MQANAILWTTIILVVYLNWGLAFFCPKPDYSMLSAACVIVLQFFKLLLPRQFLGTKPEYESVCFHSSLIFFWTTWGAWLPKEAKHKIIKKIKIKINQKTATMMTKKKKNQRSCVYSKCFGLCVILSTEFKVQGIYKYILLNIHMDSMKGQPLQCFFILAGFGRQCSFSPYVF